MQNEVNDTSIVWAITAATHSFVNIFYNLLLQFSYLPWEKAKLYDIVRTDHFFFRKFQNIIYVRNAFL